ncbi:hypothetical protein [Engelhardtia mirabilis]|uniref:Uncharacterized protein n=1 Tax=Engelhardtia mirabilis TaxID=2528011 RepID=A0A518BEQ2_9BACT|nr:hypothetical protein Pla133_05010 [Planctomycetes bacterium Pla133]QDU99762.1 hypothetical protein Pla86_05010 [Planctomycetes bacterium Pla86]
MHPLRVRRWERITPHPEINVLLTNRLQTRLTAPLTALVALVGLASSASAQGSTCFLPDQLDGAPCCTPVDANVPLVPPGSMQGTGLCWDACGLVAQSCVRVEWDAFMFTPQCSHYETKLRVFDCAGVTLMEGLLNLDYTRTWQESTIAGAIDTQVWRYVAKIDFFASSVATSACPVPPDFAFYPTSFWYGYFDFTRNCVTGISENALVLFHNCDAFIHQQPISSQPGTIHPTSTYAIVAPDTAANPFVPVSSPLAAGIVMGEAIRSTASPIPGACLAEEPILQGAFLPLGFGCLCPLMLGVATNTASTFSGAGACGGGFQSLNFWPVAPWLDFTTTSIGRWTTGATYPGPEQVHVGEGLFLYREPCDPTGIVTNSIDVFYGGITEGGYPVFGGSPIFAFTNRLIDLASNYSSNLPGPVALPMVGTVKPTEHLIYVNF